MPPFSHKSPTRIYVTLHDLHDSNGSVPEMKNSFLTCGRQLMMHSSTHLSSGPTGRDPLAQANGLGARNHKPPAA
jgi:hypothetical protein